jgi:hypothetical protein
MTEQEMLDMIREAGFLVGQMGTDSPGFKGTPYPFAMPVSDRNCLPELKNLINLAFQQGRIYERNS